MFKKMFKKILAKVNYNPELIKQTNILKNIDYKIDGAISKYEYMILNLFKSEGEPLINFKKRFFANLEFDNNRTKIIQKGDFILLNKIINLCNKHNIKYWLLGGSALGAYRHNNFIPWDDDLDIGMVSKDFLKFREIILEDNTIQLDEFLGSAKFLFYKVVFRNHVPFFYVDIFVYDEVYMDKNDALILRESYRKMIDDKISRNKKSIDYYNSLRTELNCVRNRENNKELYEPFFEKFYNLFGEARSDNSKPKGIIRNVNANCGDYYDYDFIFPLKITRFNGVNVYIPNNIKKFLELCYGDIYTIPLDFNNQSHFTNCDESFDEKKELAYLDNFLKK